MFNSITEAMNYIERESIAVIDFKLVDLSGRWHHLSIPASRFGRRLFEDGIGFDASSYGFAAVEKSDMVFIPDLSSAYRPAHQALPTLTMIADAYRLGEKRRRFEDDPRYIVRKAKDYMIGQGIADTLKMGPEFEFYVLDSISVRNDVNHMEVHIDAQQGRWNAACTEWNRGLALRAHNGYHLDRPLDRSADWRDQVVAMAEEMGIPVKYHHSENGGPGQVEIEVVHADILEMADRTMKLKSLLRDHAAQTGRTITFMPKPFCGECGSGFHIHLHLFKDGNPLFFDPAGYAGLSETALYAIGGLLRHAPALMPFTNPSTNSYKRLIPGYEAPVSICFALSNRSAVIRIPGYATAPDTKRFEIRFPDLTCNPYLTYAAVLMAMLDGIEHRIDPVSEGYGPFDVNLYDAPEDVKHRVKGLPKDLLEAADALEQDMDFLLKGGVFTKSLIDKQLETIRSDHHRVASLPHPEEFLLYYNR